MQASSTSSLMSDELYDKYCSSVHNPLSQMIFGKILHKLFPDLESKSAKSKLKKGKCVRRHQGIAWKDATDHCTAAAKLGLDDLFRSLPDCAVPLSKTATSISFGIKTDYLCNGNAILKMVSVSGNSWSLQVRGKTIGLEQHGISSDFEPTIDALHSLVDTVRKMPICIGLQRQSLADIDPTYGYTEYVSTVGDENSTTCRVRSPVCQQFRSWIRRGDTSCRRCQHDLRKPEILKQPALDMEVNDSDDDTDEATSDSSDTDEESPTDYDDDDEDTDDDTTHVQLDNEDDDSLTELLERLLPGASPESKRLLLDQRSALMAADPRGRRWSRQVIALCLNMYVRSPKSYDDLKDSKVLILPCGRQLRRYKNIIPQESGLSRDVLQWMHMAAVDAKLPNHGWSGGLIHDETKIQSDLVVDQTGGIPKLVGWVDTGVEGRDLRILKDGHVKRKLATEVFQVIFLGYSGFRFPLLHYPTTGINASDMSIIIHDTIAQLHDYGFQVDFVLQDGGSENRQFIKSHFQGTY